MAVKCPSAGKALLHALNYTSEYLGNHVSYCKIEMNMKPHLFNNEVNHLQFALGGISYPINGAKALI